MRFYCYKLFENGPLVTLSYEEIGQIYGISKKLARTYIQKDCASKMIYRARSPFKKNTYYLTRWGLFHLHKDLMTPPPYRTFTNL